MTTVYVSGNAINNLPKQGLFRIYPPQTVVVRSSRVSFTGDGQSNATAYAYFIWQKGWQGKPTLEWSLAA